MRLCSNLDCLNAVGNRKGELCEACDKKRQRDKTRKRRYVPRRENPFERLLEAAIALADAQTDADYRRAKDAVRHAAVHYSRTVKRTRSRTSATLAT